jgi:hypothetical protein
MALDAITDVLQRVLDDVACVRPLHMITVRGASHIDYEKYLKEHDEKMAALVEQAHAVAQPIIEVATDDEVHVFGGAQ